MAPPRALIIVDPQVDFCTPGGKLAVLNASQIIPVINKLKFLTYAESSEKGAPRPFYDVVIITGDSHPHNHISFDWSHNSYSADERDGVQIWPVHCIERSLGAAFHPDLTILPTDFIVPKGQSANKECFSGFGDPKSGNESELHKILHEQSITQVDVVGVALEICVRATAVASARLGFHTRIITDAVASLDLHKSQEVLKEMSEAHGIELATISKIYEEAAAGS